MLLILVAALLMTSCSKPAVPVTQSHAVNLSMNGLTLGEEREHTTIKGQHVTSEIRTMFSGPPKIDLEGTLEIERGRPVSLRVTGQAPPELPSTVDVTLTPDRTDTFPLRSPVPVHVLSALVRQSIVSARRTFRVVPDGQVDVRPCEGIKGPFPDATCHAVTGPSWGPVLVWLDTRQALAAAVMRLPFGVLLATTPERDDTHPALLELFDVYSARR